MFALALFATVNDPLSAMEAVIELLPVYAPWDIKNVAPLPIEMEPA
jgi:hypothetical protein